MKKINLYLLTGFLGSGKTTFLKEALEHLKNEKVGVIMNEFGKIGIDGTLIKRNGMELLEINRGSIFCSCLKLSFASAMIEMAERDMDYLFVESSGLSDPSNVDDILEGVASVKGEVYEYKAAICLVDAPNFLKQIEDEDLETVKRQLKHCHMAIVNKVDLVDDKTLKKVLDKISEINDKAAIEIASFGNISFDFLNKDLMKNQWAQSEDTTNTKDNKPKTLSLTYDGDITKSKLTEFLDKISSKAYRIKGFFKLEDGVNQVDVVNERIDYKLSSTENAESKLVIISKIGPNIIKPIFSAWEETVGTKMKLSN
ncbi:CobW family GTP-binding protein [Haloimpatiens sp. FM7315]|uniref:CobW family GTP-binding protein n=1 Tax=Haloimpatiens sp. FM7315 TaxID=3298609 RepID=UPI0035A35936